MTKETDFTKRKASKEIACCPTCGRNGLVRRYVRNGKPTGEVAYFHKIAYRLFPEVTDSCFVKETP